MAVCRGMKPVDGLGGDGQCRVVAEGDVGHGHVIVDGLGQGDDVQSFLGQTVGVFLGAAAADADQGVEMMTVVVVDNDIGHVHQGAAHRHFVGFVAAGAKDGAAQGQKPHHRFPFQRNGAVFH